jgi:hypothetical protein
MADDPKQQARALIDRLREQGHAAPADRLHRALSSVESGLVFTLRETLETLLTGIEAIDPVTEAMIEQLRLDVEKHLGTPDRGKTPA